MRVQDVENFWRWQSNATDDPDESIRTYKQGLHYLSVLIAIANGRADPDPETLAKAVLRGVAGPVPEKMESSG